MSPPSTLEQLIHQRSAEGLLFEKLPENKVQCYACGHLCRIPVGKAGICKVRYNEGGRLKVPRNYAGALQVDPIEKKPFFHVLPGTRAFSFGMLGCDYHCDYCQNWITSQALHDPASEAAGARPEDVTAKDLVKMALENKCQTITSTYNEPLITSEWAVEIFKAARAKGLLTSYVSNGNATRGVLEFLRPYLDCYKVDLKAFNDKSYRRTMGGTLRPVLETIERLKAMGFWLEVVTLIIPGFNDSEKELKAMARFLASVDRNIPWHVTAFYSGNRPGEVGTTENTYCPSCNGLLIERVGFSVLADRMGPGGKCPDCRAAIPGVWKLPGREPNPVTSVTETPQAEVVLSQLQKPA